MLLSVSLFTGSHGFVRGVGTTIHPYEIAFFANVFSFAFYLPWLLRTRFEPMRTRKLHVHVVRSFFNAGSIITWYIALSLMPLADATALALTSPIFTNQARSCFWVKKPIFDVGQRWELVYSARF